MALTGEEIRQRLNEFAARWGGSRAPSAAHTFSNELLEGYGVDRREVGATFEEPTGPGLMDMLWPGVRLVETKCPSEEAHLDRHREQALDYWETSGKRGAAAPRYVVLCAFHRFEVWDPGAVFTEPAATFDLAHFAENIDALRFLAGEEPSFHESRDELTREAVSLVTDVFQLLGDRRAAPIEMLRDFILQCVWSMFAEDL